MPLTIIFSCEHAGNDIPAAYTHLFKGKEEVLYSHKAIDFGALHLAKYVARKLDLPLYFTTTSRLLVEANRSLNHDQLFSIYTHALPANEKKKILELYYFPYRNQVEETIREEAANGHQVLHLAIHTFTPVLEGQVREAEIGILYDEKRPLEKACARNLKEGLLQQNPGRRVMYNSPYLGTADGFPVYLREKFSEDQYAGLELEINQKFFLHGEPEGWQNVMNELTSAVKAIAENKV